MPFHPLAVAREDAISFDHVIRPHLKHDDEVRLSNVRHAGSLLLERWVQQRAATARKKAYRRKGHKRVAAPEAIRATRPSASAILPPHSADGGPALTNHLIEELASKPPLAG